MADGTYGTWHADPAQEAPMEASHAPLWRHFIGLAPETDLSTRAVLDFGCNRGGFLRLLHALKPFRSGLGVDIARDSIAAARAAAGALPVEYHVATSLGAWPDRFDLAFSYEVVYLLPDLRAHAAALRSALRAGGVYYAVTGCHTDNPLWPAWRAQLRETTNAPVHDRSPDDYAEAFGAAGFEVAVRRFGFDGFVPAAKDRVYYPRLLDAAAYQSEHKLVFRLVKLG